jgi:hypothetical protein
MRGEEKRGCAIRKQGLFFLFSFSDFISDQYRCEREWRKNEIFFS